MYPDRKYLKSGCFLGRKQRPSGIVKKVNGKEVCGMQIFFKMNIDIMD
jgi:hypothetical protein